MYSHVLFCEGEDKILSLIFLMSDTLQFVVTRGGFNLHRSWSSYLIMSLGSADF
jgi:hypothetical protein